MSIKTTPVVSVSVDSTELSVTPSTSVNSSSNTHCLDIIPAQEVTAIKKEYSIVGDSFYAGINSDATPLWLSTLIDDVVETAVNSGLTDYDSLVQDVRNAIDSIDVASNTYVEEINFSASVDGVVGTHLDTLNATYDGKFATIVNLEVVRANSEYALSTSISDVQAEFSEEINSRITTVESAYADADKANADSIVSLTTAFADQESNLQGTADAVSGLQTYVGLDSSTLNPNGLGMLSRIDVLEKQTDGVVEFITGIYDVMLGVEDPNNDVTNDELILDALPIVQWTNLSGFGVPVDNTRYYVDYSLASPAGAQINVLNGTLYERSDFTDVNVDKYYKFFDNVWTAITEADYLLGEKTLRESHVGDVYIHYNNDQGTRNYIRSYKFIKITPDESSPYSTDTDGYTWALVTDSDAQATYTLALQARDIADGKISHFYAWGDMDGGNAPADYTVTTADAKYKVDASSNYLDANGIITTDPSKYVVLTAAESETVSAANVVLWFTSGRLYRKGASWASKTVVPTVSGNGSFIANGDLLTVFDPIEGDTSTYWYDNGNWVANGPAGIISKSKWFVDLDNAVTGANGHIAKTMSNLQITSEAYTNASSTTVENKFSYDSTIILGGKIYRAGFGLDSLGTEQIDTDGVTGEPIFDSTFRVNSERFVLTSPSFPGVEAKFNVTANGLLLSVDQTEATRNEPKGVYVSTTTYVKGDIVLYAGSSFIALKTVTDVTPSDDGTNWQLFASGGITPDALTVTSEIVDGVTTLTFSDGTSAEISDGESSGVTIIYADDAAGTNTSFTRGSYTFANYYEWVGTAPTEIPEGLTYTLFIGKNGDSAGVIPIYSDDAIGTTTSFEYSGQEYVNFYEWIGIAPTTVPAGLTYVKFVGGKGDASTTPGPRGTAILTYNIATGITTAPADMLSSTLATYWNTTATPAYVDEIEGDSLVVTNPHATAGWTHIFDFKSGAWEVAAAFTVNGNQIVTGTLAVGALATDVVFGVDATFKGSVKGGKLNYGDSANAGYWLGIDDGEAKLHIGDSNSFIRWNGSSLQVVGDIILGRYLASTDVLMSDPTEVYSTDIDNEVILSKFHLNRPGVVNIGLDFSSKTTGNDFDNTARFGVLHLYVDDVLVHTWGNLATMAGNSAFQSVTSYNYTSPASKAKIGAVEIRAIAGAEIDGTSYTPIRLDIKNVTIKAVVEAHEYFE